ncbi:MAG: DUF4397 domain-containing protein [Pyrinomonadaceae bacterium]|nr:DUF4397 domain-containing protein [Pyrinomonadaceae bacterium]
MMDLKSKISFLVIVAAVFAIALTTSSCGGSDTNNNQGVTTTTGGKTTTAPPAAEVSGRNNALVRAIHAIPGPATVDIYDNETKLFNALRFKNTGGYVEVAARRHVFSVRPAGLTTNTPLAQDSIGLSAGKHYTIFVLPGQTSIPATIKIMDDDLAAPAAGKARVRLIHASPDAGSIDVYTQGTNVKISDKVNFQSASNYLEVAPTTSALEVRPTEGARNVIFTIPNVRLEAGGIYTIIFTGNNSNMEAIVIEDRFGGADVGASPSATSSPSVSPSTTPNTTSTATPAATTETPNQSPTVTATP